MMMVEVIMMMMRVFRQTDEIGLVEEPVRVTSKPGRWKKDRDKNEFRKR